MATHPKSRGGRGESQAPEGRGRGSRSAQSGQPRVREAGAKISRQAADRVAEGHPWVFQDSLSRQLTDLEPGTPVRVADGDGYGLGVGVVEREGAIALRMVSRDPDAVWGRDMIIERIRAAQVFRERFAADAIGGAHRVLHAEGDGVPGIAADRFGDFLLVYRYSRCAEAYLPDVLSALEEVHKPRGIYLQDRTKAVSAEERRGAAEHVAGKTAPPEFTVQEDGLSFVVDVTAPVSPGLFLDLREGRRWFERIAKGARVLNLFSFTGAFGLRAVRAGASEVVNIDAAARSHARCRKSLDASGMDPEACEAVVGDVFKHLERFRTRDRKFDIVVVDPPPFSKVGGKVFSALRQWRELMAAVAPVLDEGGQVMAVSNAAGLGDSEFLGAVGMGCADARRGVSLVGEAGLPPDFPVPPAFTEGRYLRVKLLAMD
jgi:23S rRNA (cytosine1962-C5)-methyltransferase